MHVFCPSPGCGARVSYEITKPTKCPRCNQVFADAFRVTSPAPIPHVESHTTAQDDDVPEDRPLTRSALERARAARANKAKPRIPHRSNSDTIGPEDLTEDLSAAPVFPDDGADDEGEDADPREVRRKARELAASIDPESILIEEDATSDQRIFRFEDYWKAGESARKQGAATTAKPKRKARR